MITNFLKFIGYYDVKSYIDNFQLAFLVKNKEIKRTNKLVIFTITFLFLIFITLYLVIFPSFSPIFVISIFIPITSLLVGFFIFLLVQYTEGVPEVEYFSKYAKKKLKKDLGKELIKDKEFIDFVNKYYEKIKEMKMSKKKTIKFLKNWKENRSILDKEYKEKYIKEREEIIAKAQKEIDNINN